ncbi:MAG: hypothetical protein J5I90_19865 [Caldilineales bacterium]|nr:hypothetical protein [Caldilineales bacterium]
MAARITPHKPLTDIPGKIAPASGSIQTPQEGVEYDATVPHLKAQVDETAGAAAGEEGARMNLDQVIEWVGA